MMVYSILYDILYRYSIIMNQIGLKLIEVWIYKRITSSSTGKINICLKMLEIVACNLWKWKCYQRRHSLITLAGRMFPKGGTWSKKICIYLYKQTSCQTAVNIHGGLVLMALLQVWETMSHCSFHDHTGLSTH